MAGPTLTPEQIAQLESEKAKQEAAAATFLAAIPAKNARATELAVQDSAFKSFFDYYNNDIIIPYDTERKALDGLYILNPITETDILKPANLEAHRTTPSLPATDIIRVTEFDGGGTATDAVNESQHILDQADIEDVLVNGVAGTTPTTTATSLTNSALTAASTTLDMLDATGPMSFTIGDVFVVYDGIDAAVVEVTGVTDNAGGDPPYDITLDIIVHVAPTGTIAAGADVDAPFNGFTNTERTNKIATVNPDFQPIMDSLITSLESLLNARKTQLANQIAAIDLNQDPDGVAQLAAAKTNAQTSDTFITNYLLTTDISDTGITSLSTERGTRTTFIATRIGEITANYTGQTENYYDRRYGTANDRGNTSRGTLRLQKNAEAGAGTAQQYADSAQAQVDAIQALLDGL